MFAKIEDDKVVQYPIYDIRPLFPNVSFPEDLSRQESLPEGYVIVKTGTAPEYDSKKKRLIESIPVLKDGLWVQNWDVVDLYPEELQRIRESDEQLAKQKRATLLAHVDAINPIRWELMTEQQKQAWRDYRQELLDITKQESFPNEIIWPDLPK